MCRFRATGGEWCPIEHLWQSRSDQFGAEESRVKRYVEGNKKPKVEYNSKVAVNLKQQNTSSQTINSLVPRDACFLRAELLPH